MTEVNKQVETFLLENIGKGVNTAKTLYDFFPGHLVQERDQKKGQNKFRTIDAGLRRLVKAKKIKFANRVWVLTTTPVAPVKDNSLVNAI